MSNIYLKVTIEKNWCSQNFDFLIVKYASPGQFWAAPTHADIIPFKNFMLQAFVVGLGAKIRVNFPSL